MKNDGPLSDSVLPNDESWADKDDGRVCYPTLTKRQMYNQWMEFRMAIEERKARTPWDKIGLINDGLKQKKKFKA